MNDYELKKAVLKKEEKKLKKQKKKQIKQDKRIEKANNTKSRIHLTDIEDIHGLTIYPAPILRYFAGLRIF